MPGGLFNYDISNHCIVNVPTCASPVHRGPWELSYRAVRRRPELSFSVTSHRKWSEWKNKKKENERCDHREQDLFFLIFLFLDHLALVTPLRMTGRGRSLRKPSDTKWKNTGGGGCFLLNISAVITALRFVFHYNHLFLIWGVDVD